MGKLELRPEPKEQVTPAPRGSRRLLRWPTAYEARREGLLLRDGEDRMELLPWALIEEVVWRDSSCVVHLPDVVLVIDQRHGDWTALGLVVETAIQQAHRDEPTAIGAERIAEWLGIPLDGVLVCERRWLRLIGLGNIALVVLLVLAALRWHQVYLQALWGIGLLAGGVTMLLSANRIRADVHGIVLRVGGRRRAHAWSEITGLRPVREGHRIETRDGGFRLSNSLPGWERLYCAVANVAAANRAGAVLPSERPIADGALSRPGGEMAEERGLSRVET